jgi:hypothetical protein
MSSEAAVTERSAVLILRVLLDGGSNRDLQARLTHSLDISTSQHQVTTASTVDEVCDGVRSWLEQFVLKHAASDGDATVTSLATPP